MAWAKAGSTTLTSAGSSITVSSIPDSKFYKSLIHTPNGSGTIHNISTRFNSDTGSNYAWRRQPNGGTDGTGTSQTNIQVTAQQNEEFAVVYLVNISSEEKLQISHSVSLGGTGAGNAPARQEAVGKHAQTSNPIDTITVHNASAVHTYGIDSNLSVIGSD
jgi:hypothetical protein